MDSQIDLVCRRRLLLMVAPLISAARRLGAQETPNFSADVKVVNVPATVRNSKGEIAGNLTKDDFLLEDEGHARPITYFSRANDLPLTLGLLVDTSASQRRVLDQEINASREFFRHVVREDRDQAFVIHFDREVELLQDLTPSRSKLQSALDNMGSPQLQRQGSGGGSQGGGYPPRSRYPGGGGGNGSGGTMLYDAVYLASNEILKKESGAKATLVLSDGVDNGSRKSLVSAIEATQRADTPVYTILFTDRQPSGSGFSPGFGGMGRRGGRSPFPPASSNRPDGKKILERMSKETGGALFEVSSKHPLSEIYDRIEEELRNRYSLGFTPDAGGSGYRRIHLTAKQKGLVVTARDGYYAD